MIISDAEKLFISPSYEEVDLFPFPGVKQYFYSGLPYKNRPTKVFACCGIPEHASPDNPVPGVVLVHGGGATALADWVKLWVDRGYAAISMDTCGGVPCWAPNPYNHPWPRHENSGPAGWGKMELAMDPIEDQWVYHALGAVILGNSFLRSLPQVDTSRVGVTGISWGGVLTLLAAAHDPRFAFAMPVYGTGFFNTPDSGLPYNNPQVTDAQRQRWFELFDPAHFLKHISMPCFMLAGTNDRAFPLNCFWKTAAAITAPLRTLVHLEYPHDHTISWEENTMYGFAEKVLAHQNLPAITACTVQDNMLQCQFSGAEVQHAELFWTCGSGLWLGRKWEQDPGISAADKQSITHQLPRNASAAYFTVKTAEGEQYSSMPWLLQEL